MNSQSNARSQRPKGLRLKLVFQIASLLAICFWLLYQVKQSHDKDYSGSAKKKVIEEHGSGVLGRKANAGGSDMAGEDVKDVLRIGGVDDRYEGKESEKKPEFDHKELNSADADSDVKATGSKEVVGLDEELVREGDSKVGRDDEQFDPEGEKDLKNVSHDEVGNDEKQQSHVTGVSHNEQGHEWGMEEESKTKEFSGNNEVLVITERKNDTLEDQNSAVNGVHGFDDMNGVPVDDVNGVALDGDDIIGSRVTGSSDEGEISHDEMYSSLNNQSQTNEIPRSEEVIARGDGADFEAGRKISVQETEPKAEGNSQSSVHVDTPSINSVTGTTQGGSSVSDI